VLCLQTCNSLRRHFLLGLPLHFLRHLMDRIRTITRILLSLLTRSRILNLISVALVPYLRINWRFGCTSLCGTSPLCCSTSLDCDTTLDCDTYLCNKAALCCSALGRRLSVAMSGSSPTQTQNSHSWLRLEKGTYSAFCSGSNTNTKLTLLVKTGEGDIQRFLQRHPWQERLVPRLQTWRQSELPPAWAAY
jgi:hypothetical protein